MVYILLANGFEEIEAICPIDVLRRADLDVATVGITGEIVIGAHSIAVAADILPADMDFTNMEMLVLPGGMPGTLNLEKSQAVQNAVKYCAENSIPIGAICAAPSILGHLNLLEGKEATCFPGFEEELKGAVISEKSVVTDDIFTTAKGAGVALEFSLELVRILKGKAKSARLERTLQVN